MVADDTRPDPAGESSIYELEASHEPPPLPGDVVVRDDEESLHTALASDLLIHANNCVRTFGDFHLALSGGSTPMPFYRRLMVDPAYREFPWRRTHLWIVDERCVAFDDPMSNFGQIRDYLVGHSDIPKANVHPMEATLPDAPERYEREIQAALAWREKGQDRLDFVLLGMGGDGHTASLFPETESLEIDDRLVTRVHVAHVTPPDRVTMTYRLLNSARFIGLLVRGASKRSMIEAISQPGATLRQYPVLGIQPVGGVVRWYLDRDACPRAD